MKITNCEKKKNVQNEPPPPPTINNNRILHFVDKFLLVFFGSDTDAGAVNSKLIFRVHLVNRR